MRRNSFCRAPPDRALPFPFLPTPLLDFSDRELVADLLVVRDGISRLT